MRRTWLIGDRDIQIGIVMTRRRYWSPPLLQAEREIMDDDIVEPTDPVDPVVTDPVPRDIAVMG